MAAPIDTGETGDPRTVAITGASGMVGGLLMAHFLELGWTVRALQRRDLAAPRDRLHRFAYALPDAPAAEALEGVDALVHGAVQAYGPGHEDADAVNLEGSRALLTACRARSIPVVFLSSLAAHTGALSHYGRGKLAVEALLDPGRELILRPGLVLARGGLFAAMVRVIRALPVVPVLGGGRPLQTVSGVDLCRAVEAAIRGGLTGAVTVATTPPDRMIDLYRAIATGLGVRRLFVPVPLWCARLGLTVAPGLAGRVGVSLESLLGLQRMISWSCGADLRRLGIELTPMREAVAGLCRGAG